MSNPIKIVVVVSVVVFVKKTLGSKDVWLSSILGLILCSILGSILGSILCSILGSIFGSILGSILV